MPTNNLPTGPFSVPDLWTVADCAHYLQRSRRWVWECARRPADLAGSIPHTRLPGGSPRFLPADIVAWVTDGCPPAAIFLKWRGKAAKTT
ncbi:MAG: helix-turn-helix domain-containing protein [Planctomycetota bacterium]